MELKPGYKVTEVGVIPEDWESISLGEKTVKIGSGITPRGGARVYKKAGRPFFRSQNIGWGELVLDEIVFLDELTHESFISTEVHVGDVLLNITGASIGRCAVANERAEGGNVNQHVCIVRSEKGTLDAFFLQYFLLSTVGQRQIECFQAGGNRQGLNFKQVGSFKIPLPRVIEQNAISTALSDVDALITSLDKLITKKCDIKQASMQQLLTGKKRLPGFEVKTGYQQTEIGEIPKDWNLIRLADLGRWRGGATPSMARPEFWNGNIPWMSSGDVIKPIISDTQQCITESAVKKTSTSLLSEGAIVFVVRSGILRRCLPVAKCLSAIAINQDIKALEPLDVFCSDYLLQCFIYNGERILSSCVKSGTTVESIHYKWLLGFVIPLPSSDEQAAIATVLSDMDAEIAALEAKRDKTRALKQGMMQDLLTGKTRLVSPESLSSSEDAATA